MTCRGASNFRELKNQSMEQEYTTQQSTQLMTKEQTVEVEPEVKAHFSEPDFDERL